MFRLRVRCAPRAWRTTLHARCAERVPCTSDRLSSTTFGRTDRTSLAGGMPHMPSGTFVGNSCTRPHTRAHTHTRNETCHMTCNTHCQKSCLAWCIIIISAMAGTIVGSVVGAALCCACCCLCVFRILSNLAARNHFRAQPRPPPTQPLVVLRTPWLLSVLGMAASSSSSSRDIRYKRATLILFNVPYWQSEKQETLPEWWARIGLPASAEITFGRNPQIVDFVFSERRIEGLGAEDLQRAHHFRGYLVQTSIGSEKVTPIRFHWHPAQMQRAGDTVFNQRYASIVSPPLDLESAAATPSDDERRWLFRILADMPPDSAHRFCQELEARVQEKLRQLAEAAPGMSKNNHKAHKRGWTTFQEFVAAQLGLVAGRLAGPSTGPPEGRREFLSTQWSSGRG